ncbi:oxidoreductase [Knoellia sinensis KCTC 19936]|uniref:Oxidoreductase n=1 Tax=Knoellia sinensis KCTC 19936 TaxID=1385520 RepID=A0A0A0JCJ4_9MICO|nr:OsmC family protein [Knoellia sinensis]KGN33366.1 oxidoreductase [Knoellia sinensis KCTC 19936]
MTDTTHDRAQQETGGTGPGHRSVTLTRTSHGELDVTNVRGGTIHIGTGESDDFTPVELLLAAIAGCSAVDVDFITAKRAEPTEFTVTSEGDKVKSADKGNHMDNLEVTFRVRFPEGPEGDKAREMLPRAIAQSHDRLCSVSRTVQLGTPVTMREV